MDENLNEYHDLVVVDSRLQDYQNLSADLRSRNARCHLFTTGSDALRRVGLPESCLWLINTHLPDMRGMELLTLVRQRAPFAAIYLVCDRYTPQEERAARAAGATAFFCKPPSLAWLHESFYEERAGPA